MKVQKISRQVTVEDKYYVFTKAEMQDLVDHVFEIGLRIFNGDFADKDRAFIGRWIAEYLRLLEIKTKPVGISWGVLTD